jgi:hypothetical protein
MKYTDEDNKSREEKHGVRESMELEKAWRSAWG